VFGALFLVERYLSSDDVFYPLADVFIGYGIQKHIRSDNGQEFTAKVVRQWLGNIGEKTLFIEPGSPWENGYNESFNGKLRDEVLNREVYFTLKEAKIVIENWRQEYNTIRPYSSLNDRPPGAGGCLAVELSTDSVNTKYFGDGFNSNLKAGTKPEGRSIRREFIRQQYAVRQGE
jgi:hypothetical protein